MTSYSIETENLTRLFYVRKKSEGKRLSLFRRFLERATVEIKAVEDLNIKVRRGELFGLLGPNGAGKTTTIRMLSTMLRPTCGNAFIKGYSILEAPKKVREFVGWVSESPGFYYRLSATDYLTFFGHLYNTPQVELNNRIKELLDLVGLSDRADERIDRFSSGMRQRLSIARALINDPQVLLLDEPTLGLDPASARQIRSFIKNLTLKLDKTVLLTTHYMFEAEELCDRVAIINRGRVIACDTPHELKTMVPKGEVIQIEVRGDVSEELLLAMKSKGAEKVSYNAPKNQGSGLLRIMCTDMEATLPTLINLLGKHGISLVRLNVGKPSLEDAFIYLTSREGL